MLYGSRKVINCNEIYDFFAAQNIPDLSPSKSFHVTTIYSKNDVNGSKLILDKNILKYKINSKLIQFDQYLVMDVNNGFLQERFQYFKNNGCVWDYPDYTPHISLSEKFIGDIDNIIPYSGNIILGKETIETLNEEWSAS